MKIAVDMDNTLFDEWGKDVRPGVRQLLDALRSDGHELVLFTSSTRQRALQILEWHGFTHYFTAKYFREDYDPENRGVIKDLAQIGADILIDDDPKHCAAAKQAGRIGILVKSYRGGASAGADEMDAVMEQVRQASRPSLRNLWRRLK
jgi:FMN phosphatase YigB (HAD superfamily)